MMQVVRFVTDFAQYAAKEEAAFTAEVAMQLQRMGRAQILGSVEEVAGQKPVPIPQSPADSAIRAALVEEAEEQAKRPRGRT